MYFEIPMLPTSSTSSSSSSEKSPQPSDAMEEDNAVGDDESEETADANKKNRAKFTKEQLLLVLKHHDHSAEALESLIRVEIGGNCVDKGTLVQYLPKIKDWAMECALIDRELQAAGAKCDTAVQEQNLTPQQQKLYDKFRRMLESKWKGQTRQFQFKEEIAVVSYGLALLGVGNVPKSLRGAKSQLQAEKKDKVQSTKAARLEERNLHGAELQALAEGCRPVSLDDSRDYSTTPVLRRSLSFETPDSEATNSSTKKRKKLHREKDEISSASDLVASLSDNGELVQTLREQGQGIAMMLSSSTEAMTKVMERNQSLMQAMMQQNQAMIILMSRLVGETSNSNNNN